MSSVCLAKSVAMKQSYNSELIQHTYALLPQHLFKNVAAEQALNTVGISNVIYQ